MIRHWLACLFGQQPPTQQSTVQLLDHHNLLTQTLDAHLHEVERQVRWLEAQAAVMRAERKRREP